VDVERLYNALLKYYRGQTLWGDPRAKLENDIARLVAQGMSREEAIKKLFEERIGDYRVVEAQASESGIAALQQREVKVVYEGEAYGIVYVETDPFYNRLPNLGQALDYVQKHLGDVVAILPNVGFVSASIFLGTSFQGVKGVAIIYRRRLGQEQDQKA
ncbi:MAG: hypothetical protein QXU69_10060, partial [Thermofilaceae archaeon]